MVYQFNTLITGVSNIDELKERITNAKLGFKEDENLLIIYSESNQLTGVPIDDEIKSLIIDKTTLKPIVSQFNKLIYNDDAIKYLENKDWNNVTVKHCYEGTMIIVFYSHDKWYVCTRKCLDARKSYWIKDRSYYDLFMDTISDSFKLEDLNTNYCYHFILIHYENKNIVDYTGFGDYYKKLSLAMTTEKYTLNRVQYKINDDIIYPHIVKFNCADDIITELQKISEKDKNAQHITTEGFILEYVENGEVTLLKLQTPIYKYIASIKPNVSNIDAMFLELYQKNLLKEIVPYFTHQSGYVINRIHSSMKTLAMEVLNIYHITRGHKNEQLYAKLPSCYKHALFDIHGLYLSEIRKPNTSEFSGKHSITIYDVYNCLKKLDSFTLRKMFIDRLTFIDDLEMRQYTQCNCFQTMLQGKLLLLTNSISANR